MAFVNNLFHPMLSAAASTAVEASLHTGDPGTTGTNEVSGGGYSRQSVTWNSPASGAITADGDIVFVVPPLEGNVTHVGLWDSEGDWLGDAPVAVPQPFPTAGTATVQTLTLSMSTGNMSSFAG